MKVLQERLKASGITDAQQRELTKQREETRRLLLEEPFCTTEDDDDRTSRHHRRTAEYDEDQTSHRNRRTTEDDDDRTTRHHRHSVKRGDARSIHHHRYSSGEGDIRRKPQRHRHFSEDDDNHSSEDNDDRCFRRPTKDNDRQVVGRPRSFSSEDDDVPSRRRNLSSRVSADSRSHSTRRKEFEVRRYFGKTQLKSTSLSSSLSPLETDGLTRIKPSRSAPLSTETQKELYCNLKIQNVRSTNH